MYENIFESICFKMEGTIYILETNILRKYYLLNSIPKTKLLGFTEQA